jgi:heme exporter protein CcmD
MLNNFSACFIGPHGFYLSASYGLFIVALFGFALRTWWQSKKITLFLRQTNKEN